MLLVERITEGRTDLVFDFIAEGGEATATDVEGTSLLQWCAYYGDVSAIRYLLAEGERIETLGANLDLNGACYHGHWRLAQFLLEQGADANVPLSDTGETPLHAALCKTQPVVYNRVVEVLLAHGANPNAATIPGVETGGFMRDCRTKGETPLHRAAAFGDEETIQRLLNAGAQVEARDMSGDTPLSWASWYLRPASILRLLCYGRFRVRPQYAGLEANLIGKPLE
ncbi:MAG: ankyrin repeat domain-containing protein [Acidobacteria bacterium]|nr:ankyrin repeat domain-containing protein [Acidobacteriota bacterium]